MKKKLNLIRLLFVCLIFSGKVYGQASISVPKFMNKNGTENVSKIKEGFAASGTTNYTNTITSSSISAQVCDSWKINMPLIEEKVANNASLSDLNSRNDVVVCASVKNQTFYGSKIFDKRCNTGGRIVRYGTSDPACNEYRDKVTHISDVEACCECFFAYIGQNVHSECASYADGVHMNGILAYGDGNFNGGRFSGPIQQATGAYGSSVRKASQDRGPGVDTFYVTGNAAYVTTQVIGRNKACNQKSGNWCTGTWHTYKTYLWESGYDTSYTETNVRYNYNFNRENQWKLTAPLISVYDPNMLKN